MRLRSLIGFFAMTSGTAWGRRFRRTTDSGKSPLGEQTPDAVVLVAVSGCAAGEAHKAG
jgi:hypothetical protein